MLANLESAEGQSPPHGPGSSQHEIERAVLRLNAWFVENRPRIPLCLNWQRFKWQRTVPVFKAVPTTAIQDWTVQDLGRLFRVVHSAITTDARDVEVPIELLVADKSLQGSFLNVTDLMKAIFEIFSGRHVLGRFNPRLRWFWSHGSSLTSELESYVDSIRMRIDAATPVQHDQRRIFEEFRVPLQDGQQTVLGSNRMFVLDYMEPQGAVPYWRFSVTQYGEVIAGPQVLHPKPIYHGDALLAVIKSIDETTVTLSVLTSEGG